MFSDALSAFPAAFCVEEEAGAAVEEECRPVVEWGSAAAAARSIVAPALLRWSTSTWLSRSRLVEVEIF